MTSINVLENVITVGM